MEFRALAADVKARCHDTERSAVNELMQELQRRKRRFVDKVGDGYEEVLDEVKKKRKCAWALWSAKLLPKLPVQNAPAPAPGADVPTSKVPTRRAKVSSNKEMPPPLPAMAAGRTVELPPSDILCGVGPGNYNHPGTVQFRALVKARCHDTGNGAIEELMRELKRR